MMKRSLFALCLMPLFAINCGGAPVKPVAAPEVKPKKFEPHSGPRLKVAIAGFVDEMPNKPLLEQLGYKDLSPLMEEQIITELVRTGMVTVLERKQLKKLAGEIDLSRGEMAEYFSKSKKAEKGKFLQAQAMFTGAVTEFEPDAQGFEGGVSFQGVGAKLSKKTARVGIEVRLVEVETGKVIESTKAVGTADRIEGEAGVSYLGLKIGGGGYYKTPLGRATRIALNKAVSFIVDKIKDIPWETAIISASNPSKVMIRGGSDINLQVGDTYDVIIKGEKIIDPTTNEVLGQEESKFGKLKITSVQPKLAIGTMLETKETPPAGAIIRHVGAMTAGANIRGLTATTDKAEYSTNQTATQDGADANAADNKDTTNSDTQSDAQTNTKTDTSGDAKAKTTSVQKLTADTAVALPDYENIKPLPGFSEKPRNRRQKRRGFGFARQKNTSKQGIPKKLFKSDGKPAAVLKRGKIATKRAVEFKLSQASLTDSGKNLLDQIAYLIAANPRIKKIRVVGHTDRSGNEEFNQKLSKMRAQAVVNYLSKRGLPNKMFQVKWFGSKKPIADNDTEAGRKKNRRVEFHIIR